MPTEHEHAENLKTAREREAGHPDKSTSVSKAKKDDEQATNLWPLAFATAIACDALDLIPVVGCFIALPFRPFLFIFLWKQKSKKSKTLSYLMLALAFVPIVDMAPLDTASVYRAYLQSKK